RRPQSRVDLLVRGPEDDRKCRGLGDVSKTSQKLQRMLCLGGEPRELADHKLRNVIGISLGANAVEIPGPVRSTVIETEQSIFSERRYELNGEKRIATGLIVHQLPERRGALRLTAKSLRDQLSEMLWFERPERDLRHFSASGPDGVELPHQRMGGCDFIVAIGADQHEVLQIRPAQQILQQIERRRVEPLQVVEDERQRMFRPSEHADEAPKCELEPRFCQLRLKLKNRRLV